MLYPLFILAALAYGATTFLYGTNSSTASPGSPSSSGVRERSRRAGDISLAIAGLLHTGCVGAQCVEGDHPFASVFLVVSFAALSAVLGYFVVVVALRKNVPSLGAILAPVALIGLVLGVLFGEPASNHLAATSLLAKSHIGLATAGIALLTLAAGVAAVYLAMERRLRQKIFRPRPGGISLLGLDRMHHRLILLVTPVLTLALVTGVLWILQLGGPEMLGPRWLELAAGGAAWLASVTLLVTRAAFGMRGRQAAGLTIIALLSIIIVLSFYGVRG
ncbi:MAG: cytochrome c biogenesis protein CcsA [Myxococcales bacterium]|nr:cytochrome c biogenesis protein CcsA [Myxococcales bacterium]MCB9753438.1 cytochrome c biogenesis protein CcsA [Myxococcales bacterium]